MALRNFNFYLRRPFGGSFRDLVEFVFVGKSPASCGLFSSGVTKCTDTECGVTTKTVLMQRRSCAGLDYCSPFLLGYLRCWPCRYIRAYRIGELQIAPMPRSRRDPLTMRMHGG